jgi:hypothetical protein
MLPEPVPANPRHHMAAVLLARAGKDIEFDEFVERLTEGERLALLRSGFSALAYLLADLDAPARQEGTLR